MSPSFHVLCSANALVIRCFQERTLVCDANPSCEDRFLESRTTTSACCNLSLAAVDFFVHGIDLGLVFGLQGRPLQFEVESHQSILYGELVRVQIQRFDHLKTLHIMMHVSAAYMLCSERV